MGTGLWERTGDIGIGKLTLEMKLVLKHSYA